MSTKEWIVYYDEGPSLYQDVSFCSENSNPATIQIRNPTDFLIESDSNSNGKVMSLLKVDIDAERFDDMAFEWLKHRGFSAYECTLDELIEKYEDAKLKALVEERFVLQEIEVKLDDHVISNEIRQLDKIKDVTELRGIFKSED
jgi:hypothetical protein